MKRLFCMMMVLVIAVSIALPAAAADNFVPSITYKDGPEISTGTMNGQNVKLNLQVTSISAAKDKTTDISQEKRDQLVEVYEKLDSGEMKLPIANDEYVVRELVDLSYSSIGDALEEEQEEWLSKPGNTVTVEFDLGITKDTEVAVLVYVDGKWTPAEKVINRGNGTVSVVFEDLGPVAFCVNVDSQVTPPQTGDTAGQRIVLWGAVMAGSVAALLILLVAFKRSNEEEEQ